MPVEQDEFDAFLRQNLNNSSAYIPDDGFSQKVVQALPQKPSIMQYVPYLFLVCLFLLTAAVIPWLDVLTSVMHYFITLEVMELLKMAAMSAAGLFTVASAWMLRELKLI